MKILKQNYSEIELENNNNIFEEDEYDLEDEYIDKIFDGVIECNENDSLLLENNFKILEEIKKVL